MFTRRTPNLVLLSVVFTAFWATASTAECSLLQLEPVEFEEIAAEMQSPEETDEFCLEDGGPFEFSGEQINLGDSGTLILSADFETAWLDRVVVIGKLFRFDSCMIENPEPGRLMRPPESIG